MAIVDATIEVSAIFCYNAEGDRNPASSQASCRMAWTLFEIQAETGIEKRTIYKICKKNLYLRKLALKWVLQALT
jgi:hypothetical protein